MAEEHGILAFIMPKTATATSGHLLHKNFDLSLPDDFELSDEFVTGFKTIEKTKKNLYITGEAGTGKTTLLQYESVLLHAV